MSLIAVQTVPASFPQAVTPNIRLLLLSLSLLSLSPPSLSHTHTPTHTHTSLSVSVLLSLYFFPPLSLTSFLSLSPSFYLVFYLVLCSLLSLFFCTCFFSLL